MRQVCAHWLVTTVNQTGDWAGSTSPEIIDEVEISQDEKLLAMAYQIDPDGYVVVPVLKEMPPVMAFTESGHLVLDERFGPAALIRDVMADRTNKFADLYGNLDIPQAETTPMFDAVNRRGWDALLKSDLRTPLEQVGPLITTTWHQTAPYNSYCPWGDGSRSVVWCVATALAQIIRYHEWPPAGFGHTEYIWNGDQSCGGDSPGMLLQANFSDRFFYNETLHDVAELSMEVGKSYHVDYGVCYSVGDTSPTYTLLPDYFAYQDSVTDNFRSDHSADEWFAIVQEEINKNRPIDYLIFNHMIACDGWMISGTQKYYHMNYGWGGGSTIWYALDNLYCGWAGCDPMKEHMYTQIEPDRRIMFYADTIAGYAPLTLQFTGSSDRNVTSWFWTFGDGTSSTEQSPTHEYVNPGIHDVSLQIHYDEDSLSRSRSEYIYVLDDSVGASAPVPSAGAELIADVSASNLMPLSRIFLPISYSGNIDLTLDSCSVQGCRTSDFQQVAEVNPEPENKRLSIDMIAWQSGYSSKPFLDAGEGSIVRLYFSVPADALPGESALIAFNNYNSNELMFYGSIYGFEHRYIPGVSSLSISMPAVCGDADGSTEVDIDDVVYLIQYIFSGGPAPSPVAAGDADCSGEIDIDDVVYVIAYIFADGPAPCDPNGDQVLDCTP